MEEQKKKKQGHKEKGQKYKSLLVWDILQKRTDENHAIQLKEIAEHLKMYGRVIDCDLSQKKQGKAP